MKPLIEMWDDGVCSQPGVADAAAEAYVGIK